MGQKSIAFGPKWHLFLIPVLMLLFIPIQAHAGWDGEGNHLPERGLNSVTYGLPNVYDSFSADIENWSGLISETKSAPEFKYKKSKSPITGSTVMEQVPVFKITMDLPPLSKSVKNNTFFNDHFIVESPSLWGGTTSKAFYSFDDVNPNNFQLKANGKKVTFTLNPDGWADGQFKDFSLYRYFNFGNNLGTSTYCLSSPEPNIRKVIILIHGWNAFPKPVNDAYKGKNFKKLFKELQKTTLRTEDWTVLVYHWELDAATTVFLGDPVVNPNDAVEAAENSYQHGLHLGRLIEWQLPNLEKLHLISNSAGVWAARTAAKYLTINQDTIEKIQLTLLEPFIAGKASSNCPLKKSVIDNIDEEIGNKLYRVENYYYVDATDLRYHLCTSQRFNWQNNRDINHYLGEAPIKYLLPIFYPTNPTNLTKIKELKQIFLGHELAKGDYLASIKNTDIIENGGWQKSMFYEEHLPGPVTLTAPEGEQISTTLTYAWQEAGNATSYEVEISQSSVIPFVWRKAKIFKAATNSLTISKHKVSSLLKRVSYKWRVRAVNAWGNKTYEKVYGPWSESEVFHVGKADELPGIVIPISPSGILDTNRPVFRWNPGSLAGSYEIEIKKGSKRIKSIRDIQGESIECPVSLSRGAYTWYVRGINTRGAGPWSSLNFSISSTGLVYNIGLTWGLSPEDMDAHLKTPFDHVYFSNKGAVDTSPYAQLDQDDRDGYGPENISIYQMQNGTYRYYVHNYSGSGSFGTSEASVVVVDSSGEVVLDLTPPSSGSGRYWHVFDIVNGQFVIKNNLLDNEP